MRKTTRGRVRGEGRARAPKSHPAFSLLVDSLAYGGRAVGRHEGKVVFVKGALPGEEVVARLETDRGRYWEASVERILRPSADRVEPRSPAFGQCNGCHWQHLSYAAQIEAKKNILAELLTRVGGIRELPEVRAVPAQTPWAYRIRAQFRLDPRGAIGFCREKSHEVADVAVCPIATNGVNRGLRLVREIAGGERGRAVREAVREIEVTESPETGRLALHLCLREGGTGRDGRVEAHRTALALRNMPDVGWVGLSGGAGDEQTWGEPVRYRVAGFTVSVDPTSFLQVNPVQNEALVRAVLELLDPEPTQRIVEGFCGCGNFTLPVAAKAREVVAIEKDHSAIEALEMNLRDNGILNVRPIAADGGGAFASLGHATRTDGVLLDPPRAGAGKALEGLLALAPSRIVYVSCDPATLARDAGFLVKRGYHLGAVILVDMFPQTYHVESVVRFDRTIDPG